MPPKSSQGKITKAVSPATRRPTSASRSQHNTYDSVNNNESPSSTKFIAKRSTSTTHVKNPAQNLKEDEETSPPPSSRSQLILKQDIKHSSVTKTPNTQTSTSQSPSRRQSSLSRKSIPQESFSDNEDKPVITEMTTPRKRLTSTASPQFTTTPRYYPMLNKEIDASNYTTDRRGHTIPAQINDIQHKPSNSRRSFANSNMPSSNIEQTQGNRQFYPSSQQRSLIQPQKEQPSEKMLAPQSNLIFSTFLLIAIFCLALGGIYTLLCYMPSVPDSDSQHIKLPRDIEQCKALASIVDKYKNQYPVYVLSLFAAVYIFLQTFCIPGAVFLSILAGPIWGVPLGIFIISVVATAGSSLSFILSKTITRPLLFRFFPDKIHFFRAQLEENKDNLWFYLLFLRVAPIFPNWLITLASPVIDVPYLYFATATFIGIMPNNYIMTTTGTHLPSMANGASLMTTSSFLSLFGISFFLILPSLLKRAFNGKKNVATQTA